MEGWRQYNSFKPDPDHVKPIESPSPTTALHRNSSQSDTTLGRSTYKYVVLSSSSLESPKNWSPAYKSFVIAQLTFLTLGLTFASAASAPSEPGLMVAFGCSELAAIGATSSFLVGIGLGAMPFAPLSELYGRLPVYIGTLFLATLFGIGSALAPSIGALITLRFFSGFFSTAPLSNAGGTLSDIGGPLLRTLALPLFTTCGFIGPTLAPLIGGYVAANEKLGWRWCYWICVIWNAVAIVLVGGFMPETLGPALEGLKAKRLRGVTGDEKWRAKIQDESLVVATIRALKRPFKMLAVEPVVQFFIAYLTVVYTILYGSFSAYPIIFTAHGLSRTQTGLTFIPIIIGFILLLGGTCLHFIRYKRLMTNAERGVEERGIYGGKVEPEERLVPLMCAAVFFPAGLFWLAWTSDPKYSFWLTMVAGVPFGIGLLAIFQGSYQYLIDAYGPYASSALAGATLVRYGGSGLIILAFPTMYEHLGTEWATSIFAFLGLAMAPVPFLFYRYGRKVRSKCQFTVRD